MPRGRPPKQSRTLSEAESVIVRQDVIDVRENNLAPNCKSNYARCATHYLLWLERNQPELLTPEFLQDVGSPLEYHKVLGKLRQAPNLNQPPIKFEEFRVAKFMEFILSIRTESGTQPSYSHCGTFRSSIKNLFRVYQRHQDPQEAEELSISFKGLKRRLTDALARGDGTLKIGKDPMKFDLYKGSSLLLLKSSKKDACFAHLFQILSWNLMCRASNTVKIFLHHMDWTQDALCIMFANQKNDQLGEKPKDPRHIYANPLSPEICPILSLGLYFLTHPFSEDLSQPLFSGTKQYDRYRKKMKRFFQEDSAELLNQLGIDADDIGSHSCRKGACTFATSGTTAAPSGAAVHLRAGWTLPGVQNTYYRYESAGDQHVGRTIAGLPPASPEFAILPPFFREPIDPAIISSCFSSLPNHLRKVGEFCLASIVYHEEWLRENLPEDHPVIRSAIFRDVTVMAELRGLVECRISKPGDRIHPTGIPPIVSLLTEIRQMGGTISTLGTEIIQGVTQQLEERAIQSLSVTPAQLQEALARSFSETHQLFRQYCLPSASSTSTSSSPDPNDIREAYSWGGAFHLLPEGYVLPKGNLEQMFSFWVSGDLYHKIPPLREVTVRDFSSKVVSKRYSDLKFLMTHLESKLSSPPPKNPTLSQVNELFQQVRSQFDLGGGKRPRHLDWQTHVRRLRQRQRTN
jgi:hypothetical protein